MTRAIDCLVNVDMGDAEPPEWMIRVKEDTFKAGASFLRSPGLELASAVAHYAGRLAAAPTTAIGLAKQLLNRSLDSDRETALLEEALAAEINSTTEDMREGLAAFAERRPPRFVGY